MGLFNRRRPAPVSKFQERHEEVAKYLAPFIGQDQHAGAYGAYEFFRHHLSDPPEEFDVEVFAPLTTEYPPSSQAWFGLLVARVAAVMFANPADDERDFNEFGHLMVCLKDARVAIGGTPVSRQPIGDLFYRVIGGWNVIVHTAWALRFGSHGDIDDLHVRPPELREFLVSTVARFADGLCEQPTGEWRATGVVETLARLEEKFASGSLPPLIGVLEGRQPVALRVYGMDEELFPGGFVTYESFVEATGDAKLADELYAQEGQSERDQVDSADSEDDSGSSGSGSGSNSSNPKSSEVLLSWPDGDEGRAQVRHLSELSNDELLRLLALARDEIDSLQEDIPVGLTYVEDDSALRSRGWVKQARISSDDGSIIVARLTDSGRAPARLLTALGDIPPYAEELTSRVDVLSRSQDSDPFGDDIPF